MEDEYDLQQFLEHLENEGCFKRWSKVYNGYTVHHFISKNGNSTDKILEDGDTIHKELILRHLDKLEVFYLAEQMFPLK